MNKMNTQPAFALLGASRVGLALACQLQRIGWQPALLWNHRQGGLRRAENWIKFTQSTTRLTDLPSAVWWIIIAVTDDAIEDVVAGLSTSKTELQGRRIIHVSGWHTSQILAPLREKGARTGSLHPVVSIPTAAEGIRILNSCVYTCEGNLRRELAGLVAQLGGKPFCLNQRQKKFIHLAAVLLNNYNMVLIEAVKRFGNRYRILPDTLEAILQPIVHQAAATDWNKSLTETLTGPLRRGDQKTIEAHRRMLNEHPSMQRVYEDFIALTVELLALKKTNKQVIK